MGDVKEIGLKAKEDMQTVEAAARTAVADVEQAPAKAESWALGHKALIAYCAICVVVLIVAVVLLTHRG